MLYSFGDFADKNRWKTMNQVCFHGLSLERFVHLSQDGRVYLFAEIQALNVQARAGRQVRLLGKVL